MSDEPTKNDDVLEITLIRIEETIRVRKEDGTLAEYKIKEMTGTDRDKYLNSMSGKMKTDSTGKATGVRDFTGIMTSLIARCLFDEIGKPVSDSFISSWPSSAQKKVFERCQAINGLGDEKNVETAKND